MKAIFISILAIFQTASAYPPAAGQTGSDAIIRTDPRFIAWASGNLEPDYGTGVEATWRTPAKALGPATGITTDIVCLGNGGAITLYFPHPIRDDVGPDFAVFENSFSDSFLELGFVEVSSDGVNFFRFPNASLTASAVGGFGTLDPTKLSGLAGKYRAGYGTPFDLSDLPASATLDRQNVRFVRIVDIIGDGTAKDSAGNPIYDPTPTTGSGGFDLEAIGVIHQNDGPFKITRAEKLAGTFEIEWDSNPGSRYQIETSADLSAASWQPVGEIQGSSISGRTVAVLPSPGGQKCFWRLVRLN